MEKIQTTGSLFFLFSGYLVNKRTEINPTKINNSVMKPTQSTVVTPQSLQSLREEPASEEVMSFPATSHKNETV